MDPNVTLRELLHAVLAGDTDRAQELAEALQAWLRRGGFSSLPATSSSYQGWKNYETWAVHHFVTGTEDIDLCCRAQMDRAVTAAAAYGPVRNGSWTVNQARRHLLAESLKEFVDVRSPLAEVSSVYSELLGCALYKVDWEAIAAAILEGIKP